MSNRRRSEGQSRTPVKTAAAKQAPSGGIQDCDLPLPPAHFRSVRRPFVCVPSLVVGRLMAERALGGGLRPLDAPAAEGTVLILRPPSADWQAPLEAGLRLLGSAHREPEEDIEREDSVSNRPAKSYSGEHADEDASLYAWTKRESVPGHRREPEIHSQTSYQFLMPLVEAGQDGEWSDRDRIRILRATRQGRAILAVAARPERQLPEEIRQLAARTIPVPAPDTDLLVELAILLDGDCSEPGSAAWRRAKRRLGPLPSLPLRPDAALLDLAHREGQSGADWLRRVSELDHRRRELSRADGPPLENLHGYGAAMSWARSAAVDLAAYASGELRWADVDQGVLLVGPPGTGKTTLARALANSAGVSFLSASLAEWQGAREGHLGNLLRAMRETFADAHRLAPCVLLVDEIDGFGDRKSFDRRHRDYNTQVVNALLELLDGATPRDGVLVVGCTNDASVLDPALLRPGRLERVIELSLPDAEALEGILRFHLGADLPELDLSPLAAAAAAQGATGANVMLWVRAARQRARHAARPLAAADLTAAVGSVPNEFPAEHLWRTCVHEAGHALGFLLLDRSRSLLGEVAVARSPLERARLGVGGGTKVDFNRAFPLQTSITPTRFARYLRAVLMGRAAETVMCGEPSAGAGGSERSDLALATRLATVALSEMGLGGSRLGLLWRRAADNPERALAASPRLECDVAGTLADAERQALRLAIRCRPAIQRLALALRERSVLQPPEVREALRGSGRMAPDAQALCTKEPTR